MVLCRNKLLILVLVCSFLYPFHVMANGPTITGKVIGSESPQNITAVLLRNGEELYRTKVNNDGSYAFSPGMMEPTVKYTLELNTTGSMVSYELPMQLPIVNDDLRLPDVKLERGGCLHLVVVDAKGQRQSNLRLLVSLRGIKTKLVKLSDSGDVFIPLPAQKFSQLYVCDLNSFTRSTVSSFELKQDELLTKTVVIDLRLDVQDETDVSGKDLGNLSVGKVAPQNWNLTFDTNTQWSSSVFDEVNPWAIMEWGKKPGLGIPYLHSLGLMGAGVSVAYIDEPLLLNHEAYQDRNVNYHSVWGSVEGMDNPGIHGPMVTSILLGKDVGVAPECTLHYIATPPWLMDQRSYAEAIRLVLSLNETLPLDKRIKAIGISDAVSLEEDYPGAFREAMDEAEAAGVLVLSVGRLHLVGASIRPFADRDDYHSYHVEQWWNDVQDYRVMLVPSSGLTSAIGTTGDRAQYCYFAHGGLSMAIPYLLGVLALGWQINPQLSKEEILGYLLETALPYGGVKIVNPLGFVNKVSNISKFE